jgi:predicted DNA-binding helix-hairpin-helix protein
MESPTETGLANLSPEKNLKNGFFQTLFEIKKQIRQLQFYGLKTPSITTQFVVGANTDSDLDLIKTTNLLYSSFGLKRVFFSAFRPIPNTPLENLPASSLTRQHRLYQSDFLMRFYRFSPQDLQLDQNGNLFESADPKTLWANLHPATFPINLNFADYYQLLKIPGLGPVTATKIIKNRRFSPITSSNLSSLHLPKKSLPFCRL